jgi:cell shape-determining protein MreD
MNWFSSIFIYATAYLSVFVSSWIAWPRQLLGIGINLLPGLMVYTGLTQGLPTITAVSLCGGMWFDAMSGNPLGTSVLPLFLIGFIIHQCRELLLRANVFANCVLGAAASLFYPLMTLFLLCNLGTVPLLGWKTIWHLLVSTVEGGLITPLLFMMFDRLDQALNYRPRHETSFRPDRQIKRGRA